MRKLLATWLRSDKQTSHDLHLFGMNGVVWHFTQREFFGFYVNKVFLVPYVLFLALAMAFKPAAFEEVLTTGQRLVYWVLLFPIYLLVFQLLATVLCRINRRISFVRAVPSLFIHVFLTPVFVYYSIILAGALTGHPEVGGMITWIVYLRGYVIVVLFEALFIFLLLPMTGYREAINHPEPREEQSPVFGKRIVRLGPEQRMLDQIRFAKSAEHYLEVGTSTDSEPLLVRMKMKDFLAQLPPDAGVRTHRSWWASHSAADRLVSRDGRKVLLLKGGGEVPVSRSRLDEVEAWMANLG